VRNVSQWPNLRHLGEPLGGAEGLLEAVCFKKAIILYKGRRPLYKQSRDQCSINDLVKGNEAKSLYPSSSKFIVT